MQKINLKDKFSAISGYWEPKLAGELNGQHVRLVKIKGDFVWHRHDREDELFLVLDGELEMQFRDRNVVVNAGEFIIVPRGTGHCPRASEETHVLLFEPATTLNTGDTGGDRTVHRSDRI